MRNLLVATLLLGSPLAANPVPEYFFSEFSPDPADQWLELHHWPEFTGPRDLAGWTITTRGSTCTLNCVLPDQGYLVIDSAGLASGLGFGSFRLDPDCDTVVLAGLWGEYDWLTYPSAHAGQGLSPGPGPGASASVYYRDDWNGPYVNWYVDSTPTPSAGNDDYSTVSGLIRGARGEVFSSGTVWFSSASGGCGCDVIYDTLYHVAGLGPGRYRASFYGWFQNHYYRYELPDSVDVGYSAAVTGIDIIVPLTAVAEARPTAPAAPSIRRHGPRLIITGSGELTVFDQSGRSALSSSGSGVWDLGLTSLRPGIYFARLKGADHGAVKVVIPR
jgi:hypothetical protein